MGVAIKGLDPEPFSPKEWLLFAGGTALGAIGLIAHYTIRPPLSLTVPLVIIGFISLHLLLCGLHVMMVDPLTGSRYSKEKEPFRKNFPKYFVLISLFVLLTLLILCAII